MRFAASDRVTIVRVLAQRLPSWAEREAVVARAGLGDVQLGGEPDAAWQLIVDEADERGRVVELVRAAARLRPDDGVLASFSKGVEAGTVRDPGARTLRVAWALGALGAVLVAVAWGLPRAPETPATPPPPDVAVPAPGAVASPPAAPTPALARPPTPTTTSPAPAAPAAQAATAPAPVEVPVVPVPPTPTPGAALGAGYGSSELCRGKDGYAWLGDGLRLERGAEFTVVASANVRADHPRPENGYDARAPVVCVLPRGARLRLVEGPIAVQGGATWARVRGEWIAR